MEQLVNTEDNILDILSKAEKIVKTAKRHRHSLSGNGFYASKFSKLYAKAVVAFKKLNLQFQNSDDKIIKDALKKVENNIDKFFSATINAKVKSSLTN